MKQFTAENCKQNEQLNIELKYEYMKKQMTRKFITLGVMLVVLFFAIIAYCSTAWFASNNDVEANGMKISTEISHNLVIAKDRDEIKNEKHLDDLFKVVFNEDEQVLIPARHKEGQEYPVRLEYNSNPRSVSMDKGLERESRELEFLPVQKYADGDPKRYYFDYKVYIASTIDEIEASSLKASMEVVPDEGVEKQDYMYAASIDYYIDGEYVGTLNDAGKNWEDSSEGTVDLELAKDNHITIPYNKSDGKNCIEVLMRFYFDGGLEKTSGQAYVYTDGLITDNYKLTASFIATEIEE